MKSGLEVEGEEGFRDDVDRAAAVMGSMMMKGKYCSVHSQKSLFFRTARSSESILTDGLSDS